MLLPLRTYRNGTNGTIAAIAHARRPTRRRSLRPISLTQIRTTAIGCRMQRISSRTFFTSLDDTPPRPLDLAMRPSCQPTACFLDPLWETVDGWVRGDACGTKVAPMRPRGLRRTWWRRSLGSPPGFGTDDWG